MKQKVLKFAAPSFVSLIQPNNAIGIVSFDHDAYPVLPVTGPLGPPGALDLDRPVALGEIAGHTATSIAFVSCIEVILFMFPIQITSDVIKTALDGGNLSQFRHWPSQQKSSSRGPPPK